MVTRSQVNELVDRAVFFQSEIRNPKSQIEGLDARYSINPNQRIYPEFSIGNPVSGVSQTLATEVANWIEKETSALKRSHTKKNE